MANPPRRPATMRDVAERAGVSRSLVSTVFRGVPGASPSTRARVLEAASALGYRPDERARQLRSHQNTLIGVTLTATQPFHVALVELLHDAVELGGFELSITLSTDTRTLERATDGLLAQRCAAMVLIGPTAPDDEICALADSAADVPVIVADRRIDRPPRGRRAHRRHGRARGSSSATSSISATARSGTPAVPATSAPTPGSTAT